MTLDQGLQAFRALTDHTRVRLLTALDGQELTVAELTRILDVPQPRVSTHLLRLKEVGLAIERADGPHHFYRRAESPPAAARAAWEALERSLDGDPQLARDRARRDAVL